MGELGGGEGKKEEGDKSAGESEGVERRYIFRKKTKRGTKRTLQQRYVLMLEL